MAERSQAKSPTEAEDEDTALSNAANGMLRGDLSPLAAYLRAGYPLHPFLRQELINAIEGNLAFGFYTLKLEKSVSGPGTAMDAMRLAERDLQIFYYFREQCREGANRKTAMDRAKAEFQVGKSTIEAALAAVAKAGAVQQVVENRVAMRKSKESGE